MMDRDQAAALFSDYLDDELDAETRQAFEQALEADEELRKEFRSFRKTVQSLSGLRVTAPPPEFARKVERRIQRRSRGRFFREQKVLMRVPFEWFSFVIILILLVLYMTVMLEGKKVQKAKGKPPPSGQLKKAPSPASKAPLPSP